MLRPLAHHPHMAAAGLSSLGRGNDSMLVHMTPHEVGGLRQLAMAAGGDLSINPHTGLPEAGFLSAILPMIAGGLLTMTGVGAPLAAGIIAAGDTAVTGSWKNGLMAGLGAYGGASLASGLAGVGAASNAVNAVNAAGTTAATTGAATTAATDAAAAAAGSGAPIVAPGFASEIAGAPGAGASIAAAPTAVPTALPTNLGASDLSAIAKNYTASNMAGLGTNVGTNAMTGLKALGSPGGLGALGSSMGIKGMAAAAVPVMEGLSQPNNIPTQPQTPAEYYQTEYDPRTQTYKRGSWSSQYAGQGYTGAPGTDQSTTKGPVGSYANPYTSIAPVNPYAVNGKKGGGVKSLASGGQSSSNLQDYYKGLMSGTTSTSPLKNPSPDANNAFMASIGQGTAPATPTGGTGMGFLSNQQAQSATNPYGYVAPPPGATGATTTTTKPGATGTATPYIPSNFNLGGFGNLFGGGYGTTSPDASGPANVPSYSWDPATQTYTQTNSGYGGGGGGGGKAAGGGIASLNSFSGGGTTLGSYSDGGRLLKGPGDGMSDNIPAHIAGAHPQPAALADGEFVIPADVVSHLGNGSTDAGSKVLYKMMDKVRRARTGNPEQGRQINPNKFIPA